MRMPFNLDALPLVVVLIAEGFLAGAVLIGIVQFFRIPGILARIANSLHGIDVEIQETRIAIEAIQEHTEYLRALLHQRLHKEE